MITANPPKIVTKNLSFNKVSQNRRVRLSSNFLNVMGFYPGDRVSVAECSDPFTGFSVVKDKRGSHKVHSRTYNRKRSNNPIESVIEFSSQSLINRAFPKYTHRFHVELRNNKICFSPIANRTHAIHSKLSKSSPLKAFVALTGGVDIHCMESLGWEAEIVLEHRPCEARDKAKGRDVSEVHALNTLINSTPSILINEDIHHLELDRLSNILAGAPPVSLCHYSLGCDDHSTTKSLKAKQSSFDDLTTMYDMVYPMLKQIEVISPAAVLVENVKGFASSGACKIMTTTLRRLGYFVSEMKLNALDYGALQGRNRYYMVGSIYPGFQPPPPTQKNQHPLKKQILDYLHLCRDVTDTKSIQARTTKNRVMPQFVTVDSLYTPTILKSQDRGISDAVYISHEGRVYKPTEELIKEFMSIPEDFDVSWMAKEQATETLGQSIDYKLHHSVMKASTDHINVNLGKASLVKFGLKDKGIL